MASANASGRKPSLSGNGDGGAYADRILLITAIQVDELPFKKIRKVFVVVKSGAGGKRTVELKGKAPPLRWDTVPLKLDTKGDDSVVSFRLYQKRFIFFNSVLGSVERPLKDFLDPNIRELSGLRITLPNGDLMFSVNFENDALHVAHHLIKSSSEPALNAIGTMVAEAQTAMSPVTQLSTPFGDLFDSFEPYGRLLDRISEVHPIAQVAWFVVSSAYKVVKAQYEQDQAICELYIIMMNAYKVASKDDILRTEQDFSSLFDAMIKQSIECSLFISGYSHGGYLRRLTRMNISQKIEEFKSSFQDLEQKFTSAEIRVTAAASLQMGQVVSEIHVTTTATLLEVRQAVEFANLQKALDLLVPRGYSPLSPRASCMPKTRRATLSMIMDWIARGKTSVMWLHGLAGTGKSSVMGSLSDISLELGASNRRAAFIRFDRAENNDPSIFVRSLAYEMAKFDDRIGKAIAESVRKNPGIVQHTQLAKQFSALILDPLSSKHCVGMKDEGPIAVLVDGVDECAKGDMRKQLLALLVDGFKGHPYVRLILSSRPEEDLTHTFEHHLHIRRVPLDITSPETTEDIRYFINTKISEMGDNNSELQEYCKTSDAVYQLSERASGLFIWASTVLKFIEGFPMTRLRRILETDVPTTALAALTTLYQIALSSVASEAGDEDIQSSMRGVLGAIMVTSAIRRNMRVEILTAHLAHRGVQFAGTLVNKMGALVAPGEDGGLRLLHKSFDDFLTDKSRCEEIWFINTQDHARDMLSAFVSQMFPFLRDPTSLPSDYRDTFSDLRYAWLYYFDLFNQEDYETSDSEISGSLAQLFKVYLLRWLVVCLQIYSDTALNGVVVFLDVRRAVTKAGFSKLGSDIEELLYGIQDSTEEKFLQECFRWLCRLPSSSPLRQIYLPAYVEMAGGSVRFNDILGAIDREWYRTPPLGVENPYDVEILDIP